MPTNSISIENAETHAPGVQKIIGSTYTANKLTVSIWWQTCPGPAHSWLIALVTLPDGRLELHTLTDKETGAILQRTGDYENYAAEYHAMIS